jgi:hypothetical protein
MTKNNGWGTKYGIVKQNRTEVAHSLNIPKIG